MKRLIDIEDGRLEAAKEAGGHTSYKETVNTALQEYIQKRRAHQFLEEAREGHIMRDIADEDIMREARR